MREKEEENFRRRYLLYPNFFFHIKTIITLLQRFESHVKLYGYKTFLLADTFESHVKLYGCKTSILGYFAQKKAYKLYAFSFSKL